MRKSLLAIVFLMITTIIVAQTAQRLESRMYNKKNVIDVENVTTAPETPVNTPELKGTTEVDRVYIGMSANIYTALLAEQRFIYYDDETESMLATFRSNPAIYPGAESSGTLMNVVSTDKGMTWGDAFMTINDDAHLCRYPSGAIFNPEGNTDPNNAYGVTIGPVTDGAGWIENFYGNLMLDGTVGNVFYETNDATWSGDELIRSGMHTTRDEDGEGYAHIVSDKHMATAGGLSTELALSFVRSQFDGTGFNTWETVDVPVPLELRTGADAGTTKNYSSSELLSHPTMRLVICI